MQAERITGSPTQTTPKGAGEISKREKYNWSAGGQPGQMRWINKHELHIDPRYQRERSESRVRQIAREWSWVILGVLVVAERPDRTLVVLDGQHRAAAAMSRDDVDNLPCIVFPLSEIATEAMAFYGINTTGLTVSALDRHRARLVGGDPVAIAAAGAVTASGYRFAPKACSNGIVAVRLVENMFRIDPDLAGGVVGLACEVGAGAALTKRVLEGLWWVARRDDRLLEPHHRRRLAKVGAEELDAKIAREMRLRDSHSNSISGGVVLDICNKMRRGERRLDMGRDA